MRRGKDHLHAMGVRAWGDEVKDRHLACLAASVTPRLGLRELGPLVVELGEEYGACSVECHTCRERGEREDGDAHRIILLELLLELGALGVRMAAIDANVAERPRRLSVAPLLLAELVQECGQLVEDRAVVGEDE